MICKYGHNSVKEKKKKGTGTAINNKAKTQQTNKNSQKNVLFGSNIYIYNIVNVPEVMIIIKLVVVVVELVVINYKPCTTNN